MVGVAQRSRREDQGRIRGNKQRDQGDKEDNNGNDDNGGTSV